MGNNNKSNNLQTQSERTMQVSDFTDLQQTLILAMANTCIDIDNLSFTEDALRSHFKGELKSVLIKAIKKGSMGAYGISHKLTPQVIGYWIYQFKKENQQNNRL